MRRARTIGVVLLWVATGGGCHSPATPDSSVLRVWFPGATTAAQTSQDAALCAQLDAHFTLVASPGSAVPVLDDVRMDVEAGSSCVWSIGPKDNVPANRNYDIVTRFVTNTAVGTCDPGIDIGTFLLLDVGFPFGDDFPGFIEELFFTGTPGELNDIPIPANEDGAAIRARHADALSDFDFDLDNDGYTNLTDLRIHDPCAATLAPTIELIAADGTEGQDMDLVVTATLGGATADLGIRLSIRHNSDLSDLPYYKTLEIVATSTTGTPNVINVTPAVGSQLRERWDLVFSVDATNLEWTFRFVPEDPFVGLLNLRYELTDALGESTVASFFRDVMVTSVDDPTRLILDDGSGNPTAVAEIAFPELIDGFASPAPPNNNTPIIYDIGVEDDDVPTVPELAPTRWRPVLAYTNAPLFIDAAGTGWTLRWSRNSNEVGPKNADAATPPGGGYQVTIDFIADDYATGHVAASVTLPVVVSPTWNDPPTIVTPTSASTALPDPPFASHVFPVYVRDPDRVPQAPACTVAIIDDTACAGGITGASCAANGTITGDTWRFDITLTPAADYLTRCGNTGAFGAALTFTDVPPANSTNGALTTGSWCQTLGDSPPCTTTSTLMIRPQQIVTIAALSGGPSPPPAGWEPTSPALVHGPSRLGVVSYASGSTSYTYIVDLDTPGAAYRQQLPPTDFCELRGTWYRKVGVASDTGPLMIAFGYAEESGTCWTSPSQRRWLVINTSDRLNPTYQAYSHSSQCPNAFQLPYASADQSGNIWVYCYSSSTGLDRITRIDPTGAIVSEDIDIPNMPSQNEHFMSLNDGTTTWLVAPTNSGLFLIDAASFDDGTPGFTTQEINVPGASFYRLLDNYVDVPRNSILLLEEDGNNLLLYRLNFPALTVDGPLALGFTTGTSTSWANLIVREPWTGSPEPVADLTVWAHYGGAVEDRDYIDLDTWTIIGVRPETEFFGISGYGTHRCPDRRFSCDIDGDGLGLVPWDLTESIRMVDLGGVPYGGDSVPYVTVSDTGHLIVVQESPDFGDGPFLVIYFPESERGED